MNRFLSKYFFYYPSTFAKGEFVGYHLPNYRNFQTLPKKNIQDYQQHRIDTLIKHAMRNSVFYRRYTNGALYLQYNCDEVNSRFHDLPFLTKQDIISYKPDINTHYHWWSSTKTTGGSTGEPVTISKNPNALARERAATWRAYEWAGIKIGDKQARFWGIPHTSHGRFKAKLIDFVSNRRRLSAFNLTEESLSGYYKTLLKYKPHYLYGYVSVIEAFACYIKDNNLAPIPSLTSIITTAEVLTEHTRFAIQDTFGIKVFNEYGCGEVGSIAHECEHGKMHIMADNLYLEIDGDKDSGEIVVTDFFNYATPLIRYKIGDFATLDHGDCECGRTLPILKSIHGRAYDLISTSDGRILHPEAIMYIFESVQNGNGSFKHFQVIQEELNSFNINIVPSKHWSKGIQQELEGKLKQYISPEINTHFKLVDSIPRENSGKMRVIKSNISLDKTINRRP